MSENKDILGDELPRTVMTDQRLKHLFLKTTSTDLEKALFSHLNEVYMYAIELEGRIESLEAVAVESVSYSDKEQK